MFSDSSNSPAKPSNSGTNRGLSIVLIVALLGGLFVGLCTCLPLGIAVFLPAIQAARNEVRTVQSMNNMRQIHMALMSYQMDNGKLPPAHTLDENGNPLASWRTLILPFLEQQDIYRQVDLSRPWDSNENSAATNVALAVYRNPHESENELPITNYVAVVGPLLSGERTAFAPGEQCNMVEIQDGIAQTILIVEILNSDIVWYEPRDIDANNYQRVAEGADPKTTNVIPETGAVAFCDGHILRYSADTDGDAQAFKKHLTIDGGD